MNNFRSGRIFTFYSYKGGAGRSMMVANLSWVLAASGKRVLIIDWDLEAPGLHRYFHPFLEDKELTRSPGLVDLLVDYADKAIQPLQEGEGDNWYVQLSDVAPYLLSINFNGFQAGGHIDLLPAGRQGTEYVTKLHAFDWDTFYDRLGGGNFFEVIKKRLRQEYDYILIDSRTGVSDTAGICTVQMPDALIVMFTYNNQSIRGALAVARSAIEARQRDYDQFSNEPFRVFPVPSRADTFELKKLERRRAFARKLFQPLLQAIPKNEHNAYWAGVEIPYNSYLNYEEILSPLIFDPIDQKMPMASVLRLATYITDNSVTSYYLPVAKNEKYDLLQAYERVEELLPEAVRNQEVLEVEESREDALVSRAERALGQLSRDQIEATKRLMLRLVRFPTSQEASGLIRLLLPLRYVLDEEEALIGRFINVGILQMVHGPEENSWQAVKLVDGDWLLRWNRINDWATTEKPALRQRDRIQTALQIWRQSGKTDRLLLEESDTSDAKKLLETHKYLFTPEEVQFINDSNSSMVRLGRNPFLRGAVERLGNYTVLFNRVEKNKELKGHLAKFFWINCFSGIFRSKERINHIFFESGSTMAYVADYFLYQVDGDVSWRNEIVPKLHITTNNMLVFIQYLFTQLAPRLELRPQGLPDKQYGATYGILGEQIGYNPPYDEQLDSAAELSVQKMANQLTLPALRATEEDAHRANLLILGSTSGMNLGEPLGLHVGSYRNMLFKRALFLTRAPIVFFADDSKFERNSYNRDSCFLVCTQDCDWREIVKNQPISFCVGARNEDRAKEVITACTDAGLTHSSGPQPRGSYGDCVPFIVANDVFSTRFPNLHLEPTPNRWNL